ncbi:MAG: PAS domain S-box protein, partial [Candidatus Cloacimonetes bacterium]|nr:PAS domain S-box protein [Candidatus Cloacimonadota bacterium]
MGKVHKQLRFIQILLSGSVSLISLLVLCVKLGKSLDFCSGNAFLCEMAPSTAMIVFLISTAHFLKNVLPDSKILIWFTRTLCLLITAYSISVLLHILGLLPWHPEDLLKLRHYRQTGLYFGAMSPITAFIFMLGAISLQLQNTASEDDRRNRQVSVVFSSISLVISLIVLLGYMTGVPLLPILYRVPMVYLTSLCLTTLSLSILLGSGIDVFPHKLFISSSEGIDRTIQVYNSGLLMVFLGICIFVALIAALYLRIEANTFNKSIREQLNSIADLKTEQIRGWISEVHSYARYIGEDHILHNFIYHIVHERSDPQQSKTLHDSFQRIIKNLPYRSISLLDRSGRCLISYPDNVKYRDVDQIESFRKSFAMKSIIYEDILIDDRTTEGLERNQTLRIWIPVYHNLVEKDEVCATILIQIDPHDNLYPLIQTWPTPSITAETLLVRKEGESVLFLNELRHRSDTALNLSMKLSENPFLLATQAVKGAHGNIEGEDYRKHSVLGAIRYLEVYPWYLIAKIDRAEVMSPLVFKAWTTILILLVLLVSAAVTIEQINRKRTNAENLKVANEWRATFDAVQDVIWLMDKDSRIIRSNKAAETMLGLSSQLLLGDRCWQIVHKSDSPPANCPTQQLMQTGKHTDEELIIEDKWYQISVDPIFGENRNITGMVHIIRDITERKIAEKSLYETNSYLQNLLNHANAPIIVWNTEFTITQFNHAFERLIGQNAENYIGRHLEILFPKESSMESMRKILDTLTGEYWDSVEIPVLTIDGSIRTILWNSANIYDTDGITHVATIAQGQDITERIQAEQEIKDREARLQVIIDAAPFGAHTFELTEDDRLVLISSNESSDLILGIDTQALIGKELLEAFPG